MTQPLISAKPILIMHHLSVFDSWIYQSYGRTNRLFACCFNPSSGAWRGNDSYRDVSTFHWEYAFHDANEYSKLSCKRIP